MRPAPIRRPLAAAAAAALPAIAIALPATAGPAVPAAASAVTTPPPPGNPGVIAQVSRAPLPSGERYVCPPPARAGQMECLSIVRSVPPGAVPAIAATRVNGFYSPADLRSAYKLGAAPFRGGRGDTIAIVDAFSDPRAAADLARYRSRFHLGACTTASGCLRIVNQAGRPSPLPAANWSWAGEESVDLDMVSAICPNCRILLVEARAASIRSLVPAERVAIASGARYISNSWAGGEFAGQNRYARSLNHPGTVIDFASGDSGYGPAFPPDLQYVTSIGGTTLKHAPGKRGWTESVWGSTAFGAQGTGSGCSALEPKPSWQRADDRSPGGCLNRTENDVAAVANPRTGVAIFDSYPSPDWLPGWNEFGGTSVATPLITAIYAIAGHPERRTYPAEYPYLHPSHLFNVPTGTNGTCEASRQYLCHGGPGYNGPTGLGTPDGITAFRSSGHLVTVVDPGTSDVAAGGRLTVRLTGLDTRSVAGLRWHAAGLPAGLSIRAVPHSTDALITGSVPTAAASYRVTVTATDGSASGSTRFSVVAVTKLSVASAPAGPLVLASRTLCADGGAGQAGQPVRLLHCTGQAGQEWAFVSLGRPGNVGTLRLGGRCLSVSAGPAVLARCDSTPGERFGYQISAALVDAATGRCLAAARLRPGTGITAAACDPAHGRRWQAWRLPAGFLLTGAGARCLDNPAGSAALGDQATVAACGSLPGEVWSLGTSGSIRATAGFCLDGSGSTVFQGASLPDGTPVVLNLCSGAIDPQQVWVPGPGGQLINGWSGRCLAYDPQAGGTGLVIEDCYGAADEIWDLN
ncbi:MAG TPA: ricin-type beta-trefoil lectin domain protein [Streptosporangiaceae bacterium]|nr:ricin-type beta-trefoil lectin domain protein [Streptosporangiaceae bacterium]